MLNKMYKVTMYTVINILTFISAYFVGLFVTSPIICVTLSIISIIRKQMPLSLNDRFWIIYLVASLPASIIIFFLVEKNTFRLYEL